MDQRFILVACHRGKEAMALHREYKVHDDRFDFYCALLDSNGWTHVSRKNSTTHYRFKHGRNPCALEVREVARLFWPPSSKVDPRTRSERRHARQFPKHARPVILREWDERQKARAVKRKPKKPAKPARRIPGLNAPPRKRA